jgi:hypothetical protein
LALGLGERGLGPHGKQLTGLLALCAVLPILLRGLSLIDWRIWRAWLPGLIAIGMAGIWYEAVDSAQYFALGASLAFLAIALRRSAPDDPLADASYAFTVIAFAIFVALRDYVDLWTPLIAFSTRITFWVSSLGEQPLRLGPTYSGLWLLVAFLLALVMVATGTRHRPWRLITAFVLLPLLALAAIPLRGLVPTHDHGSPVISVLSWRLVQFILLLIPIALLTLARSRNGTQAAAAQSPAVPWRRIATLASMAAALTGLVLLSWSRPIPWNPGNVLIDTRGTFDMEPVRWGAYGREMPQGASLATLPFVLDAYGFETTTSDTLVTEEALAQTDVLVVMNPDTLFTDAEHAAIWEFVHRGGGLLVLGDHTNIMGVMEPFNSLLQPVGISLNFDSVIPKVDRWSWYGCMRFHPHPVTRGLRDEAELKLSVGASLALDKRAVPLLSGRDAYSDAGDWDNAQGAYLGNMAFDRQEIEGDLIVAAEATHGRGKVIAFGDTSPFQRSTVSLTHELVARVFNYLGTPGRAVAGRQVRIAGGIMLLVAGGFLLGINRSRPEAPALFAILALIWLMALENRATVALPPGPVGDHVAWLDLSHGNRVDLHAGRDEGLGGLENHLWRHDFVPLAMREFDSVRLHASPLFVTVAPAFPFSRNELTALRGFVENGGLLIVSAGYEERNGSEGLLAEFGYGIGSTPLGSAHVAETLLEGQRVLMHESWPVLQPDGRGEVWVQCWGYPIVVFETIGAGGLLVIADSMFLGAKRLESPETYVEQNIDFLRKAIETAQQRMGGK